MLTLISSLNGRFRQSQGGLRYAFDVVQIDTYSSRRGGRTFDPPQASLEVFDHHASQFASTEKYTGQAIPTEIDQLGGSLLQTRALGGITVGVFVGSGTPPAFMKDLEYTLSNPLVFLSACWTWNRASDRGALSDWIEGEARESVTWLPLPQLGLVVRR